MRITYRQPPNNLEALPAFIDERWTELQSVLEAAPAAHTKSAVLDLSGGLQKSLLLIPRTLSLVLVNLAVTYPEATDTNAGVTCTVETANGATVYASFTSGVSKAAWAVDEISLSIATLRVNEPVLFTCAGGKTGPGTVQASLEYDFDDSL